MCSWSEKGLTTIDNRVESSKIKTTYGKCTFQSALLPNKTCNLILFSVYPMKYYNNSFLFINLGGKIHSSVIKRENIYIFLGGSALSAILPVT